MEGKTRHAVGHAVAQPDLKGKGQEWANTSGYTQVGVHGGDKRRKKRWRTEREGRARDKDVGTREREQRQIY